MFPPQVKKLFQRATEALRSPWFLLAYCLVYFAVVLAVALNRWWQFEYYYFDHGIFDQSLWHVAHGRLPFFDHLKPQLLNQFGDHFTPTLYLLAPLYWVTSSYEALIILQSGLVVASAAVMWFLAQRMKISPWLSAALLVSYTWFAGLQNTLIAGFHTELIALLTLALAFYSLERKWWKLFWIFLILTLGSKEIFASIVVGVGVYLLAKKKWLLGLVAIIGAVVYFLLVTKWIIPAMSGYPYGYTSDNYSLVETAQRLVWPALKLKTVLLSFATFGFLPILAWEAWPLIGQDFFVRFVLGKGTFTWDFGFHYSAMSAILLYWGALLGARRLQLFAWYRKIQIIHAVLIVLSVAIIHYEQHGALGLSYNRTFYTQTAGHQFLQDFIEAIPNTGVVMTQNNLAPHLTHTHNVMLLRGDYWHWLPDVIALDIRDGQNPNNAWPGNSQELYQKLRTDPNYTLHKVSEEQVYFTKKAEVDWEFYLLVDWKLRQLAQ